jgi:hypothetical protein
MNYRAKDWGWVRVVDEQEVRIEDDEGNKVAGWVRQEWIDDPNIFATMINAVAIALTKGAKEVKKMIK